MPAVLSYGVSYSDFWQMTLREIRDCIKYATEKEKALLERKEKHGFMCAAFSAFFSGYYSRVSTFPSSLSEAFPSLFSLSEEENKTDDGADPGERAFLMWAMMHNSRVEREERRARNGNN